MLAYDDGIDGDPATRKVSSKHPRVRVGNILGTLNDGDADGTTATTRYRERLKLPGYDVCRYNKGNFCHYLHRPGSDVRQSNTGNNSSGSHPNCQ